MVKLITERKARTMEHTYEIRKLEDNGSARTIEKFIAGPKEAKRKSKEYAERYPGLYTLYRIETAAIYFTEKEKGVKTKG